MSDLIRLSAGELACLIRNRETTSVEVVEAHLRRIEDVNPRLNAITHLDAEGAMRQAGQADRALAEGAALGPLHGVPMTMKSSFDVQGLRCECGSRFRQGYVAQRDAPVTARLRDAGAVILGTTNTPDMLMAYETDNFLYGRSNNPWDLDRTPGGSSGGESAAIASGCSPAGFGSDGGGSIRVPAHFCGLAGLKPTPGLIPRTGHFPACLGPGAIFGMVGPMARRVADLRLLLEATAGPERHDPSSAPVSVAPPPESDVKKVRIGWFEDDGRTPVSDDTRAAVRRAAQALADAGFEVEPIRLEGMEDAIRTWWILFGIAGYTLTQPLVEGRKSDIHPLVATLFDLAKPEAEALPYPAFLDAWVTRDRLMSRLLEQMERFPVLLGPTASIPAFRHGEREWTVEGRTVRYPHIFAYSQIFNLTSNPNVVVPAGKSAEGLPIGVQLTGRHFEDPLLLAVAGKLEEALGLGVELPML